MQNIKAEGMSDEALEKQYKNATAKAEIAKTCRRLLFNCSMIGIGLSISDSYLNSPIILNLNHGQTAYALFIAPYTFSNVLSYISVKSKNNAESIKETMQKRGLSAKEKFLTMENGVLNNTLANTKKAAILSAICCSVGYLSYAAIFAGILPHVATSLARSTLLPSFIGGLGMLSTIHFVGERLRISDKIGENEENLRIVQKQVREKNMKSRKRTRKKSRRRSQTKERGVYQDKNVTRAKLQKSLPNKDVNTITEEEINQTH